MRKDIKKRISKTLKFSEITSNTGKFLGGGILNNIKDIPSEVWVGILDDPILDRERDEEINTGRIQLHLGGTRQGMEELGVFLLALAHYYPPEPGYSLSFELNDIQDKPIIHLVIHLPVNDSTEKSPFSKIHNVATAKFSIDGKQIEDKTSPFREK